MSSSSKGAERRHLASRAALGAIPSDIPPRPERFGRRGGMPTTAVRIPRWRGAADMVAATALPQDELWKREPICVSCGLHKAANGSCECS